MHFTFGPARMTGLAIFAVAGATALTVGACSSSKEAPSPAASKPAAAKAGAKGPEVVRGLIASVSGNAIQVTQKDGTAAVAFSPTTRVSESNPAQLTNVTNGNCVVVVPAAPPAGGAVTAKAVNIVLAGANGQCSQPKAPAKPAPNEPLRGTVASVEGDTITVSSTDANGKPTETAVKVDDKTRYNQSVTVDSGVIAQGKCITASGKTKDASGTLQATTITLAGADNGKC